MKETLERIDIQNPTEQITRLFNEIQRNLMLEAGVPVTGGVKEAGVWIMANAAKFREEINKLWEEINQDPHYIEIINLFKNDDAEPLKEEMLKIMRERMET